MWSVPQNIYQVILSKQLTSLHKSSTTIRDITTLTIDAYLLFMVTEATEVVDGDTIHMAVVEAEAEVEEAGGVEEDEVEEALISHKKNGIIFHTGNIAESMKNEDPPQTNETRKMMTRNHTYPNK